MIHKSSPERLRAFNEFHNTNKGYCWKHKETGMIYDKLDLFDLFYPAIKILQLLSEDRHPDFKRKDKPGWVNGIFEYTPLQMVKV